MAMFAHKSNDTSSIVDSISEIPELYKNSELGHDDDASHKFIRSPSLSPLPEKEQDIGVARAEERSPISPIRGVEATASRGSFHTMLNKLTDAKAPDLKLQLHMRKPSSKHESSSQHDQKRGGAHRGTKDYPHLPKADAALEREQRQGLVGQSDESENDSPPFGTTIPLPPASSAKQDHAIGKSPSPNPTPRPLPYLPTIRKTENDDMSYPPSK